MTIARPFSYLLFAIFLAGLYSPLTLQAQERWYSQQQVEAGKTIFNINCAGCHGVAAVGTTEWRKAMANGKYPPPPLNGTAHGWHHPLSDLRRQINEGGAKLGGWMPALDSVLQDREVDEVIAYIQSLWPDRIYTAWLKKDRAVAQDAATAKPPETNASEAEILRHLSKRIPNSQFGVPEETPMKGIYRLKMDDTYIYISDDGRYVFLGDMVDLVDGINFTRQGIP